MSTVETSSTTPSELGRQCTAHIQAARYTEALQDARNLVRMLPDASIGYLKAARCYRLLRRFPACQTMLDHAAQRCTDDKMLAAIRSESRKLKADIAAPLPNWLDRIPEDIFVEIVSFLDQADIIKATHVCQRWRAVLLRHPRLWKTLHMCVSSKRVLPTQRTSIREQAQTYLSRLCGGRLEEFQLYLPYSSTGRCENAVLIYLFETGLGPSVWFRLDRLSLRNVGYHFALERVVTSCKSLRFLHLDAWYQGYRPIPIGYILQEFPHLLSLDLRYGPNDTALRQSHPWPKLYPYAHGLELQPAAAFEAALECMTAKLADNPDEDSWIRNCWLKRSEGGEKEPWCCGLRHLSIETEHTVDMTAAELHPLLAELRLHGDVDGSTIPDISMLKYLRRLSISDTVVEMTQANSGSLVSLPLLEELDIGPRCTGHMVRNILDHLDVPRLQAVRISSCTGSSIDASTWAGLLRRSPDVTDVKIDSWDAPFDPSVLVCLHKLRKLRLVRCTLATTTISALAAFCPALELLDVSYSTPVTSSPLLRAVQAKKGQITELGIEGCTDLEKAAVEWCKKNVRTVRWTGWRDRSEGRAWGLSRPAN